MAATTTGEVSVNGGLTVSCDWGNRADALVLASHDRVPGSNPSDSLLLMAVLASRGFFSSSSGFLPSTKVNISTLDHF